MDLKSVKLLKNKGIDHDLIELSGNSVTAEEVVENADKDIEIGEVCKTIVVESLEDEEYFGIFLRGIDRIDFGKLENVLEKEVTTVDLNKLKKLTGRGPGEICPILLDFPLIIDDKVFESKRINFGSGDPNFGLEMRSEDLRRLDYYLVGDVSG